MASLVLVKQKYIKMASLLTNTIKLQILKQFNRLNISTFQLYCNFLEKAICNY